MADLIGWVDPETVESFWADAPADDTVLASYLLSSYEQCVEFLPEPTVTPYPDPIPERYRQAQIMQARALFRANVAGSGDVMGGDGLTVTVFPMDWTVKNLLRPKKVGRVL